MDSLERNRVFSIEDIEGLKNSVNSLMEQAVEISRNFNKLVEETEAWADRIPDMPEGNTLKLVMPLYAMNYVYDDYTDAQRHANELLSRIIAGIPYKDKEAADLIRTIREEVSGAGKTAEDLKTLLTPGIWNLSYHDFSHVVDRMFPQNELLTEEEKMRLAAENLGFVDWCTITGDPVNAATGNFFFSETDICIRGVPFLKFERMYNSLNKRKGIFGRGWSSSFEISRDKYMYQPGGPKIWFSDDGRAVRMENEWGTGADLEYNAAGHLISVTGDSGRKLCFEYESGLLTAVRDDMGREVKYGYHKSRLCKVTNPMGQSRSYEYGSSNRIEKVVDEKGNVSIQNQYDEYRRVMKQKFADGGEILYQYPSNKNFTEVTYQDGHVTRYFYNNRFETSLVTDDKNQESYESLGCQYRDIISMLYELAEVQYDDRGNIVKLKRGEKQDTISYGENGCPDKICMGEGCEFRFEYDGYNRIIKRTDGRGYSRSYEYDLCNRLTGIYYPDGSSVSYSYDCLGNVIRISKSTGKRYELQYDELNHITGIVENEDRKMEISYDKLGNPDKVLTPEGSILHFKRKKCSKKPSVEGIAAKRQEFNGQEVYDPAGNVIRRRFTDGREYSYEYDCMNRITAIIENSGGRYDFTYGRSGKCISRRDPSGGITRFRYDKYGNMSGVTDAAGRDFALRQIKLQPDNCEKEGEAFNTEKVPAFSMEDVNEIPVTGVREKRDDCGRLIRRFYPGGAESGYEYDYGTRLCRIYHKKDENIFDELKYEYDPAGNCVLIRKYRRGCPEDSGEYRYEYDCLNRLIGVYKDEVRQAEYQYDKYGNRTKKVQGDKSCGYSYDSTGELCYTEDKFPETPEEGISILCRKKSDGEKEYEVRRGRSSYRVIYRTLPEAVIVEGQTRFLLTDHLGSVLRVILPDGTEEYVHSYDEFGCPLGDIPAYAGYAGYVPVTEDVYATESRYYAPCLGRFLTRDTWMGNTGNPQTWNPWIYAVNNPVRYKDASGYSPVQGIPDTGWYIDSQQGKEEAYFGTEFIEYCIQENAASGGKGFKGSGNGAEQETFLEWLDSSVDSLMHTGAGDFMAYGSMAAANLIMPGVMPAVYSLEMIIGGKNFEEATGEIQDFFRGFNKSVIEYVPETIYGILSIPDALGALGESISENGFWNTMKAMGEGIVDGITTTINDKLINGTAQSRGEVAGDCAMIVADFVIGSKLLKKAPAKAALPDGDDAARVIKAADKAEDVLKGTEDILKDKADDVLKNTDDVLKNADDVLKNSADDILKNKTDDVLEHVDDLSEVKNKGAGVVDDVVEGGSKTVDISNPVLDNIRTGSALKGDPLHAFNDIIDNYAGDATKFSLTGGDGVERTLYQIEGSLNGKQGIFEWIVDPDPTKGVTHRRFIEGVGITGKPNARP